MYLVPALLMTLALDGGLADVDCGYDRPARHCGDCPKEYWRDGFWNSCKGDCKWVGDYKKGGDCKKKEHVSMNRILPPVFCFSGSSTVETEERGNIPIGNLRLGDNVLTYTHGKGVHYTEFLGWLDRDANADGKFLKISTNSSSIVLTGNHLIFRLSADVGLESVFADQIEEGDKLVSWKGEETVVGVEVAIEKGSWDPLTMEGTLLVDGLLASSYASFSHHASDLLLAPVKMFPRLLLDDQQSQHEDGCRQVIKLMKKMGTAAGYRERNQEKKENSPNFSPNEQLASAAASAAGFFKPVEL